MRALTVLYAGNLAAEAKMPVFAGKCALDMAKEKAAAFPGTEKLLVLGEGDADWTVSRLLKTVSEESQNFDFAYFAWADSPFLDSEIAGRLAERHIKYAADYSYAEGWPLGLAPELLAPGVAGILYKIAAEAGEGPVRRDALFSVLQKDINAFDIETEISPVDLRYQRLNFAADSKRNLLLLERFFEAGASAEKIDAAAIEKIIAEKPELLRTLPAFFSVQIVSACPPAAKDDAVSSCRLCPYRAQGLEKFNKVKSDDANMGVDNFAALLEKIEGFAGDAVIDISFWGECALHPEIEKIAALVLEKPALSLVIETSGLGWKIDKIEAIAAKAESAPPRNNKMPPLSWIVSLNEKDLPASQANEAAALALSLAERFPKTKAGENRVFVQAVRTKGAEDAIETFYRAWKKTTLGIIIQKYNSFCKTLPDLNAVDLSPVKRRPCWHLLRDFPVLSGGAVPLCASDYQNKNFLGNAFAEELNEIWKKGEGLYRAHCAENYQGNCGTCDEYYTFNF
jgi:spiro-SPASM protein